MLPPKEMHRPSRYVTRDTSQAPAELVKQPRLAHARLTDDAHHLPTASFDLSHRDMKRGQVMLPPHEAGEGSLARRLGRRLGQQIVQSGNLTLASHERGQR